MTGEQYIALLVERQQAYMTERGIDPETPYKPLLEWFVRPGDEDLFDPSTERK